MYMYTSQITFGTVGSQGTTVMAVTKENETPDSPSLTDPNPLQNLEAVSAPSSKTAITEACSPKSVYALASKVRPPFLRCKWDSLPTSRQIDLKCLRDLAFDNIKSQLDEKNIIEELFSPFTAESAVPHIVITRIPNINFRPVMSMSDRCNTSYSIQS